MANRYLSIKKNIQRWVNHGLLEVRWVLGNFIRNVALDRRQHYSAHPAGEIERESCICIQLYSKFRCVYSARVILVLWAKTCSTLPQQQTTHSVLRICVRTSNSFSLAFRTSSLCFTYSFEINTDSRTIEHDFQWLDIHECYTLYAIGHFKYTIFMRSCTEVDKSEKQWNISKSKFICIQ